MTSVPSDNGAIKVKRYVSPWKTSMFVELETVVCDEVVHRRIVRHNLDEFGKSIDPRVHKLLEIGYVKQRSRKWKRSRQEKITSSKVAAVIGHNYRCTREAAFNAEVGRTIPFKGNEYTAHGITYEPVALDRYMYVKKTIGLKFGLIPHPKYDYIGGSPDLITLEGILVEVKCPYYRNEERMRSVLNGEVPKMYMPQIQLGLEITGLDTAHYVEYYPACVKPANAPRNLPPMKEEIFVVTVQRDPEWFATHFPIIERFHDDLVEFNRVKRDYTTRVLQHLFRYRKRNSYASLMLALYFKIKLMHHMGKQPKQKPTEAEQRHMQMMQIVL